jgi:hypothetical protein
VGSLGQVLDVGLVAVAGHADGERLDAAASADVDLPGRWVGHRQQSPLVDVQQRLGVGDQLELPRLGMCGLGAWIP